jgi:hypothetical protein
MKKTFIFLIFLLVSVTLVPAIWAQNQNNQDNIAMPMNIKGCWSIAATGSQVNKPPMSWDGYVEFPEGVLYLKVTTQRTDGSFSGTLYRYDNLMTVPFSDLVTFPVKGKVIGSTFSFYTTAPEDPPTKSTDEYRYWTGSLMADGTLIGMCSNVRHFAGYWSYTSAYIRLTHSDDCP